MKELSDSVFVAGQISAGDLEAIAGAGITTIINNRPDGEAPLQPLTVTLAAAAESLGIAYHDVPVSGGQIGPEQIEATRKILAGAEGPVLAFCASGARSTMVWAMSQLPEMEVDDILADALVAGYDFRGYRNMLMQMKSGG